MQSTRRLAITVMTLCVYSYATAPRSGVEAAPVPMQQGFTDTLVFSGLNAPTAVRFSPDGRVFVAEKSGIIKVFDSLSDTQPTIYFATSGPQTLRIQGREDGVSIDQVVLSRGTYLVQAPGAPRADSTILK